MSLVPVDDSAALAATPPPEWETAAQETAGYVLCIRGASAPNRLRERDKELARQAADARGDVEPGDRRAVIERAIEVVEGVLTNRTRARRDAIRRRGR